MNLQNEGLVALGQQLQIVSCGHYSDKLLYKTGIKIGMDVRLVMAQGCVSGPWGTHYGGLYFDKKIQVLVVPERNIHSTENYQTGVNREVKASDLWLLKIFDRTSPFGNTWGHHFWLPLEMVKPTWTPKTGDKCSLNGRQNFEVKDVVYCWVSPTRPSQTGLVIIDNTVHYSTVVCRDMMSINPLTPIVSRHVTQEPKVTQTRCQHEYVNVGFFSITMACKHCGKSM